MSKDIQNSKSTQSSEVIDSESNDSSNNKSKNSRNKGKRQYTAEEKKNYHQSRRNGSSGIQQSSNSENFLTVNLSTALVTTKFLNRNMISQSFRTATDNTLDINFGIMPIPDRLALQAQVWARKLVSMQDFNLRIILSSYPENWEKLLIEAFTYSYYKAVLYALSDKRVAELPADLKLPFGHSLLYQFLLKQRHSFQHQDLYISYSLNFSDDDLKKILEEAQKFPYIKNFMSNSPRFYLENEKLDRFLNGLASQTKPSDGPKFMGISESTVLLKNLSQDNFPFLNSFYTEESDVCDWKYCYKQNTNLFRSSTLFGKACFIYRKSDSEFNDYFESCTEDDDGYLVKYEVACLAGSDYPNPSKTAGKASSQK
jgi:hypothetical protein